MHFERLLGTTAWLFRLYSRKSPLKCTKRVSGECIFAHPAVFRPIITWNGPEEKLNFICMLPLKTLHTFSISFFE